MAKNIAKIYKSKSICDGLNQHVWVVWVEVNSPLVYWVVFVGNSFTQDTPSRPSQNNNLNLKTSFYSVIKSLSK